MKKALLFFSIFLAAFTQSRAQQAEYFISPNINFYYQEEKDTLWSMGPCGLIKRDLDGNILKWYHRGNTPELLDNTFRAMARDKDGLWFATDIGVVNFNGKKWQVESSIDKSGGFCMSMAADGTLWTATYDAVYSRSNGQWTKHDIGKSLTKRALIFDTNGDVLVLASYKIFRYNGKQWTTTDNNTIGIGYDIMLDNSNQIWVGKFNGMAFFDGSTWKNSTDIPETVRKFVTDASGARWAITTTSIYKLEAGKWVFKIKHKNIAAFGGTIEPKKNRLWIGGSSSGLTQIDLNSNTAKLTRNENAMQSYNYNVNGILRADDRIIAHSPDWLSIFENKQWVHFQNPLDSNSSWGIREIHQHPLTLDLWIASLKGMFTYTKNKGFTLISSSTYNSMTIGQDGAIWAIQSKKIFKLENKVFVDKTQDLFGTIASDFYFNNIKLSSKGELWVATSKGLYNLATKKIYNKANNNTTSEDFLTIFETSDGKIWTGLRSSSPNSDELVVIDKNGEIIIKSSVIPTTSEVFASWFAFYEDEQKNIWITTNKGFAKYDGSTWKTYKIDNTPYLFSNSCSGITKDKEGNLWLAHWGALSKIKKETLLDAKENKAELADFQLFPNPASSVLNLGLEEKMLGGHLQIYDIKGTLLYQQDINSTQLSLSIEDFSDGLYLINIQKQQLIASKQFIIQR